MPEVEVQGIRLHYEVLGRGQPVAFLNGVMMTTHSWVYQTSLFRRRFRCVVHDFRGQLLSDKPDRSWNLADHAADFEVLLDHLEIDSCHIVGTSFGAEVAMIFAADHPERVKSLSLIAAVSEVGPELDQIVGVWSETALSAPERLYSVAVEHNFSKGFAAANPEVIAQGEARLAACPAEFFPAFARLVDAFRGLDVTDRLDRIECPTLVVVGDEDALKPPRYSRLIAAGIRGAESLVIPGAGHAVIVEKPSEVNTALLGFIEKHG